MSNIELTQTVQGTRTGLAQPDPQSRVAAWGVLGHDLDAERIADPREAMQKAGLLGWNVHTRQMTTASFIEREDGSSELVEPLAVPDAFATVANIGGEQRVLGTVGARYAVIQNEDYLPLFDAVVANETGATVTAAGSYRNGSRTFMAMHMPMLDTKVGNVDPVDMYLIGQNSHDGSSGFQFALTPVRMFCTNQLRGFRMGKDVSDKWTIRHTRNYRQQLDQVRALLGEAREWEARFKADADAMLRTSVSDQMFREMMSAVFPEPGKDASAAALTRHENRASTLANLWHDSVTVPDEMRNTAWGLVNVVTEYVDHYAAAGHKSRAVSARAERNLMGRDESVKARAWDVALELV